jgi:large subunit ribosomal protein L35
MPKLKSHRGAVKRFKLTGTDKVKRAHAMKNHILTKKSQKRKRHLRKSAIVVGKFARNIRAMIST